MMRMYAALVTVMLMLVSGTASAQGFKPGQRFKLPANLELTVVNESGVKNAVRTIKFGDTCVSSRSFDELELLKVSGHTVRARVVSDGASGRDVCPNKAEVMLLRATMNLIFRDSDNAFTRSIVPDK